MSQWLNRTVLSGSSTAENGTNSHTCTFTPASSGNFLVAIVSGDVTFTTPAGWTLQTSAVNFAAVYVFTKTASSGESSFSTTHNGSGYGIEGVVYEFLAGTSFLNSNSVTGMTGSGRIGPQVTGLTGTYSRFAVHIQTLQNTDSTASFVWTLPTNEDYDSYIPHATQNGLVMSIAYDDEVTGTSFNPTSVVTTFDASGTGEGVAFALSVVSPVPILVASYEVDAAGNLNTLVTPSFTPFNGEVLVIKAAAEAATIAIGTPSGGSQTYTSRVSDTTPNHSPTRLFTSVIAGSPGSMTVSLPFTGSTGRHSMVVERWSGAQLASSPATVDTTGTGAPSTTLTTTSDNSIVSWVDSDWSANPPGIPTYRSNATQDGLHDASPGQYVAYYAYQTTSTAGSQTLGMTSPTGQTYTIAGIEIKAAGGIPTVATSAVNNLTTTTVDGNGSVTSDGGSAITDRGFYWSTSPNPGVMDNKVSTSGTTGTYSATITGLTAGILYHARAYATNANGIAYGNEVTFWALSENPIFIASYKSDFTTTTSPKTVNVTTQDGDTLVVMGSTAFTSTTVATPTGGTGVTWTLQVSSLLTNLPQNYIWTATSVPAQTFTLSVATSAGAGETWGFNCVQFRNSTGIGASASTSNNPGAPTLNITTTQAHSAICVLNGDENILDGGSRTWRTNAGAFTELEYDQVAGQWTVYDGYHPDAGTPNTYAVGLSAPTGQRYAIVALEVLGTPVAANTATTSWLTA